MRPSVWNEDPFEAMDRMLNGLMDHDMPEWSSARVWGLPLDVVEKDDAYVVHASIPGIAPEALDVTLTDNVLTIQAESRQEEDKSDEHYVLRERRFGSFTRSIRLPMPVEADKIEATCANGELTLMLPKAETVRPRRIAIGGAPSRNVIEGQVQAGKGWAQGQATSTQPGNGQKSQGWAEGQAEKPKTTVPEGEGFAEGQAGKSHRNS
jgi:HSP20 family protein